MKQRRNEPCKCGSGKKFKACCGAHYSTSNKPLDKTLIENLIYQKSCIEAEREKQQGLGKPILSRRLQNKQVVAVGNTISIGKWKTFTDFLWSYLIRSLDRKWIIAESEKPTEDRHPINELYNRALAQTNAVKDTISSIKTIEPERELACLLDLAYNLYLLEHNIAIQRDLIQRIKQKEHFFPALYEGIVAGTLIKAGYSLEFEDERDVRIGHCELVATCKKSGTKFSVEAKLRRPDKKNYDVGNQLYAALSKPALYQRLVFIELSIPPFETEQDVHRMVSEVETSIHSRESKLKIDGAPAPPAYIIITNHPYFSNSQKPPSPLAFITDFKIPEISRTEGKSIRELFHNKKKHKHIYDIFNAIKNHTEIPQTFDGSIPEISLGKKRARLFIGDTINIIDAENKERTVTIVDFLGVSEEEKQAFFVAKMSSGEDTFVNILLSDEELSAYKKYPQTFFGKHCASRTSFSNPIELFEWMISIYSKTDKETLLDLLKNSPSIDKFRDLEQSELVEILCEGYVINMANSFYQ